MEKELKKKQELNMRYHAKNKVKKAKLYNLAFLNPFNEFIYLTILSLPLSLISFISNQSFIDMLCFQLIVCLMLSITTVRSSNVVIISLLTKHLSMNVKASEGYHKLDYLTDKNKVSELFKEEFIEGILNAYNKPFLKTIKMTTHSWVVKNVISDKRITDKYEVKISEGKVENIFMEATLLMDNKYIKDNIHALCIDDFKRKQYKVVLKKKKL